MLRNRMASGLALGALGMLGLTLNAVAQEKGGATTGKPAPTAGKPATPEGGKPAAEIGKPAPDFTLKDTEGKEVKLSSFKGKIVVLEWTNHECPIVKFHHGDHDTMLKTLEGVKGKDVVWLAIDSSHFCQDKVESIKGWAKSKKLPYPILLDPSGATGHAFGAKNTPHMFIIDKDGNLAYAGAIDDNRKTEQGKANVKNYVAEALASLISGQTVAVKTTDAYGCSVKYKP